MAKYKQVGYGSQGSGVTELQELLNANGYNLNADGIFGEKTQAAVKDYQQKNNLSVDGIVGDNTWGTLKKTNSKNQSPTPSTPSSSTSNGFTYDPFQVSDSTTAADKKRQELEAAKPGDFTYADYEKSDVVKQAEALLQQQIANKPGEYQSQWQTQLDETLDKILNREKFSYDLNGDALYQQYKDQYMLQGQQAMMDTMGQAQAMTGGYANSYAQSVGQQTYQGYLQQLNDRVPELYQLALDQYNREGDALYNQYGIFMDRDSQDYGRYRDQIADYNTELDRLTNEARYQADTDYNRYMDAYNMAYGQHRDSVYDWQQALSRADEDYWNQYSRDYGQYSDNRNLAYQTNRDQVADSQWEQAFKYQQEQDRLAQQQWQAEFDEAKRQFELLNGGAVGGSGGGSGGSGGGGGSSDAYAKQQELINAGYNIALDGVWGPQSQAAWDDYNGKTQQASGNPTYRQPTAAPTTEDKMYTYVNTMLNKAVEKGVSSQWNPSAVINANSSLTAEEKKVAQEILNEYINSGYMK